MSRESSAGVGRWRETRSPRPTSSRARVSTAKWAGAALLSGLLLAAAGIAVWIAIQWIFPRGPRSEFLPFLIGRYQKANVSPLPWVEADGRVIRQAQLFSPNVSGEGSGEELTREVMVDRLAKLQGGRPDGAVVVYLATRALVDGNAAVQIVAADSDPRAPRTLLPLRDILTALGRSPARNKLLILDIMSGSPSPLELGGTSDGVADLIARELNKDDDPGRPLDPRLTVLAACSPGEIALWSEPEGQSLFGHFFARAFSDPEADGDQDQAVSVAELAGYLVKHVDRWASQHRGRHQRPILLGSKKDFPLAIVDRRRAGIFSRETRPEGPGSKDEASEKKDADKEKDAGKEKEKDADKEKEKAEGEKKSEDKKDAAKASGASSSEGDGEGGNYPEWLAKGWALRAQWVNGGEMQATPRLLRRLETVLLRAEREWRVGRQDEASKSGMDAGLNALSTEMEAAMRPNPIPIHSVGQARAFGRRADPALVDGLKAILERRRKPEPFATAEQIKAQLEAAVKAFLGGLKGKTSLDLAHAIAEASKEERFDPETVKFLDMLVGNSALGLDVVELRTLRQLALRPASPPRGERDGEAAMRKLVWETVLLAEEANNRPPSFARVRGLLDEADTLRHDAEVLLLPKALGYASGGQILQAWQRVADVYVAIDNVQERLRRAGLVLDRARAVLPAYLSDLEGPGRAGQEGDWHQVAQAAHRLDRILADSAASSEAEPLTRQALDQLGTDLAEATQRLETSLAGLLRPFGAERMRDLVRRCELGRPGPESAEEAELVLTTPFPAAEDRARLWKAGRALDHRLGELDFRPSGSTSDASATPAERGEAVRELTAHRVQRLTALLQLAGPGAAAGRTIEPGTSGLSSDGDSAAVLAAMARAWGGLAGATNLFHDRLVDLARQDQEDRPGWIAPAFALESVSGPARQARDRAERAAREWLGKHYRHESLDLHDLVDTDRFFETAAQECARSDQLPPGTWLEVGSADESASTPDLSGRKNRAEIGIRLFARGTGAAEAQKVALEVLEPDDPRLRVLGVVPPEIELPPQASRTATIRVAWVEEGVGEVDGSPPAGLIVRARLADRRTYHLLVPLSISPPGTTPRLVLRGDPGSPEDIPFDRFRLRTVPGRQGFSLHVKNPAPSAREVVVELLAGSAVMASSGKPFSIKGGATVPVPSFGAPAPKPGEPLGEAPAGMRLRLRDPVADQVLDEQPLQPAIAMPQEYLEVTPPRFVPALAGRPNRLEVSFQSLPQMTGPPCKIRLIIPSDREIFPAYREPPKGKLEGDLKAGGDRLDLIAEDIPLDPAADEEGQFQITIDGLQRVLWYRTRFLGPEAKPQVATVVRAPRVRFRPEIQVKPGERARLRVAFQVDNAPANARLVFELGRSQGGKFLTVLPPWEDEAKRRHLGFDPKGEGGTLLFEAAVEDWIKEFDISQTRGRHRLQASLIDPRKREVIQTWGMDLDLDDLPPQIVALEAPREIEKGNSRIEARATVRPPASGIKEAAFIVGNPSDFAKAEAEGKAIKGKARAADPNTWEAVLPVPKDASGKLVVTARFTSGVGLAAMESAEVIVREPPPPPEAAAGKPKPEEPGAIEGKVTENDIAQPGLEVILYDLKAKEKENPVKGVRKTGPDGTYSFTDLKPGSYRIYCVKPATSRRDVEDVTLESGKTVRKDLDLLLQ